MRLLFAKHSLAWPRFSGHDVHTYYMMKACGDLGHEVALATVVPPEGAATAGLELLEHIRLSAPLPDDAEALPATWLQNRFRSFWGIEDHWVAALRQATDRLRPDAVVVGGLDALPFFPALRNTVRIWYAADEWVLHHLSQVQRSFASVNEHLKAAAIKGVYERAHRHVVDRAWVVSSEDQRAMRRIAGIPNADLLPNGVDSTFFSPGHEVPLARSAAFWGRLDFGPNIQALEWFCAKVWPVVRKRVPDATFSVIGSQPTEHVRRLLDQPGMTLQANVRDLRSVVRGHAVAVLPFVSGAGIKNKLLEAAALGLPIVATTTAARGLRGEAPLVIGATPEQLAQALEGLWSDDQRRRALGAAAREWVVRHHSWNETARQAMMALENSRHSGSGR